MRRLGSLIAILSALLYLPAEVHGETIRIPVGEQAPEKRDLPRPERGMDEAAVLERFGLPARRNPPVGEPPISSWHYADYIVYFESGIVIHSVLRHTPRVPLDEPTQTR